MSDRMLIMADPSAVGFYQAMGATLERHQEIAPGFPLGVYWYELTREASRPDDSETPGPATTSD